MGFHRNLPNNDIHTANMRKDFKKERKTNDTPLMRVALLLQNMPYWAGADTPFKINPPHKNRHRRCHDLNIKFIIIYSQTHTRTLVKMILSHPAVFIHVVQHISNYVIITNFLLRDYDAYIPYYCLINTFVEKCEGSFF